MADDYEFVPSEPAPALSARPPDVAGPNSTLAERAKAAKQRGAKQVDAGAAENKAVKKASDTKSAARKKA